MIYGKLKRGRFVEYTAAIQWALQILAGITEMDVKKAFAFSKMSITDEM